MSKIQDLQEPRQQIGGYMHRSNRGFADRYMQMAECPNRSSDLEDCLQPDHKATSNDTGSGRAGTQIKCRHQVTKACFQIFIKTPEKQSFLVWVHAESTVLQLKQKI